MNYAQARQRTSRDGRWDWTVMRDDLVRPAGYCAGPPSKHPGLVPPEHWRQHLEKVGPFLAKYHTDGHATKEEAERCFYGYELDQELREVDGPADEQHRCQARWWDAEKMQQERFVVVLQAYAADGDRACDQWTQRALALGHTAAPTWLCDGHRIRAVFEALHPFSSGRWAVYS